MEIFLETKMDFKAYSTSPSYLNSVFLNKVSPYWVKDEEVLQCYKCKTNFSFLVRKHHCRRCLKIFCYQCSDNFVKIKDEFKNHSAILKYGEKDRLCDYCYEDHEKINLKELEIINILFSSPFFELKDYCKLRLLSKNWNKCILYFISKFYNLKEKIFCAKLSKLEKILIKNNYKYFYGHHLQSLLLLKVNSSELFKKSFFSNKNLECENLKCKKTCEQQINVFDSIIILEFFCKENLGEEYLDLILKNISKINNIEKYVSFFIRKLNSCHGNKIYEFITKMSENNLLFSKQIYWEMKRKKDLIERYFLNYKMFLITKNIDLGIKKQKLAIEFIKGRINFKKCISPLNLEELTVFDDKKQLPSGSKPILYSFNQNKHKLLYKRENLENDYLFLNLITICNDILKKDLKEDFNPVFYDVLPLSKDEGIIKLVNNAKTISELESEKITILNYILKDENQIVSNVRNKFIKSTAFYSTFCYLFGVRDRHLNNIMVKEKGNLFQIDFGNWVFGRDPKNMDVSIRLTDKINEAIGGTNSKNYDIFKNYIKTIYQTLVNYYDLFIILIQPNEKEKLELDRNFCLITNEYGDKLLKKVENQPQFQFWISDVIQSSKILSSSEDKTKEDKKNTTYFDYLKIW